jgi:hypothetical protein
MSTQKPTPTPASVPPATPPAEPDDDATSVAGEEDPGAALDMDAEPPPDPAAARSP